MSGHLLIGATGGPNYGDELIMQAWIAHLRKVRPDLSIHCDGFNLQNVERIHGTAVSPKQSFWTLRRRLQGARQRDRAIRETADALTALNLETIHFIGGGYFNSVWPEHYAMMISAGIIANQLGCRLIATGQGLTPSHDMARALAAFDFVDTRDAPSYNLTSVTSASLSGDDALLALDKTTPAPAATLLICLQNDLFPGTELATRLPAIIRLIGLPVVLVECMASDVVAIDGVPAKAIRVDGLIRSGFPIHPDSVVITSRYHPHFLAALGGLKGVALASTHYYRTKHESVQAAGSGWRIMPPEDISQIPHALDECRPLDTGLRDSWVVRKQAASDAALAAPIRRKTPAPISDLASCFPPCPAFHRRVLSKARRLLLPS